MVDLCDLYSIFVAGWLHCKAFLGVGLYRDNPERAIVLEAFVAFCLLTVCLYGIGLIERIFFFVFFFASSYLASHVSWFTDFDLTISIVPVMIR